jgi:predicted HTH domain antitoxin
VASTEFALRLPADVIATARLPPRHLEEALKVELALQLYRESILTLANAHRLAGLTRLAFQRLLGQRKIERQYGELQDDLSAIELLGKP